MQSKAGAVALGEWRTTAHVGEGVSKAGRPAHCSFWGMEARVDRAELTQHLIAPAHGSAAGEACWRWWAIDAACSSPNGCEFVLAAAETAHNDLILLTYLLLPPNGLARMMS